ncbi:urokinase plasminogen activator surface receptor-like, partial [Clarias magur]
MKTQSTLLFISMLFSEALSLTCLEFVPSSGKCEQTTCRDQCLTATYSVYVNGAKLSHTSLKTCGMPEMCTGASMNLGEVKVNSNVKCCKTDFCNTETLPETRKQTHNDKKCFTCNANDCSGTVQCEGSEDRCIAAS